MLIVAPFIKRGAFERLLRDANPSSLRCVTRWKPVEIAAGVSDLEVYESVRERGGAMWLRGDLHAKYYRSDQRVVVGSANLTHAALGWSDRSNLEFLCSIDAWDDLAIQFESVLWPACVPVTDDLYQMYVSARAGWEVALPGPPEDLPLESVEGVPVDVATWLPMTRQPQDLYRVYSTSDMGSFPRDLLRRATSDLSILALPKGLPEGAFKTTVATALLTTVTWFGIDSFVATPRRFGAVRDFLRHEYGFTGHEANERWQTIIRWLQYFLPHRYLYSRPGHSEIISRR